MENFIEVVVGAIVGGAVVGLVPYFVGKNRDWDDLGLMSLVLCIVGNFIGGLYISVPICIASVIVILAKK